LPLYNPVSTQWWKWPDSSHITSTPLPKTLWWLPSPSREKSSLRMTYRVLLDIVPINILISSMSLPLLPLLLCHRPTYCS
jgi:hypothetical protein